MKAFTLLPVLATITATAAALPNNGGHGCLREDGAEAILNNYIAFITHSPSVQAANATAQALFAENYVFISDSVGSLDGTPLGIAEYTNKQKYISDGLAAPPFVVTASTTLGLYVVDCNKMIWFFNFPSVGSGQYEVRGFNLFTITGAKQISQNNLEFNSLAWALDTGFKVTPPSA